MPTLVRRDVPPLRHTMKALGIVVAEVDTALRYVWIENPHPDFDPATVIGKRDDQLMSEASFEIMALKQQILDTAQSVRKLLTFGRSDGVHHYLLHGHPVLDAMGRVEAIVTFGFEIALTEGNEIAAKTGEELTSRATASSAIQHRVGADHDTAVAAPCSQ